MTTLQEVYPRTQDLPLALRAMINREELTYHGRTIERGGCDCHAFGLAEVAQDHLVVIDPIHDVTKCVPGCPLDATCLATNHDVVDTYTCLRPFGHPGDHGDRWPTGEIIAWSDAGAAGRDLAREYEVRQAASRCGSRWIGMVASYACTLDAGHSGSCRDESAVGIELVSRFDGDHLVPTPAAELDPLTERALDGDR